VLAGVGGHYAHDLLPLPYTEEALAHVVSRVQKVQEYLGRPIAIENVSSYVTFRQSQMTEWEFLSEMARRAGCGILLDVNNIYVSARNHGFDPVAYLDGVPADKVCSSTSRGTPTRATSCSIRTTIRSAIRSGTCTRTRSGASAR